MGSLKKTSAGIVCFIVMSLWHIETAQAQCWRCIAIDWNAYCTSSYMFGGRACTSFGTSCYTHGSCTITPPIPPLPPFPPPSDGIHSASVDHSICASVDSGNCAGAYSDLEFGVITSRQREFLAEKSAWLNELLEGLSSADNGIPIGVIPQGIQITKVNGKPHVYEFSGEIHMREDALMFYFEFDNHPALSALDVLVVLFPNDEGIIANGHVVEWLLNGEKRTKFL